MKTFKRILGSLTLLISTVILWIPIYYLLIGAFKVRGDIVKYPLVINPEMFTLENFSYAISRMHIWKSLLNTTTITVTALLMVVVAGSLAGFSVSRINHKGFKIFYSVIVALMVIPFIGVLLPIVTLIRDMNLVDNLLGNILIQAAWNLPFAIFLFAGFMRGIPKDLELAAYIDGCSTFGIYFRIFLPLLKPVIATCCIRSGIGIWNDYLVSASLLNVTGHPTLMVSVYQFFGQYVSQYGYAFAGIVMASLPIVVMFIALQKYFVKGMVAGAVKG